MAQSAPTVPTPAVDEMVTPLRNQIATLPLVSRQSKSLLPSPLKSPVSTMLQLAETRPRPPVCKTAVPFISQTATLPVVSRHTISALPSPLKSPVATIDHVVGTVAI